MKFTTSTQSIAAAAVFLLQFADAKPTTAESSVFGWQYELDTLAPTITTQAEIYTIGDAYNQTVGIELVGDTMMMIDMLHHKQVATMAGPVDEWARANYPGKEITGDAALVAEMKSELVGFLDGVRAGTSVEDSLAKRSTVGASEVEGAVQKRAFCACPVLPISCLLIKCKGICLLFACTGGKA